MKTKMHIILPGKEIKIVDVEFSSVTPSFDEIKKILDPYFNDWFEHVSVLFDKTFTDHSKGVLADMFVDESGLLKNLAYNLRASEIYAAMTFKRENVPLTRDNFLLNARNFQIVGPAIVFENKIWF